MPLAHGPALTAATAPAGPPAALRGGPEAMDNLAADFNRTLRYLNLPPDLRPRVRTNNPIERFMLELEEASGHIPPWEDLTSWERRVWIIRKKLTRMRCRPTLAPSLKQITRKS